MPEYRIQFEVGGGLYYYQGRGKGFGQEINPQGLYDDYVSAVGAYKNCKRNRIFTVGGKFEGLASRLQMVDNETGNAVRPADTGRPVNYQTPAERDLAEVEQRNSDRIKRDRGIMQMNRRGTGC